LLTLLGQLCGLPFVIAGALALAAGLGATLALSLRGGFDVANLVLAAASLCLAAGAVACAAFARAQRDDFRRELMDKERYKHFIDNAVDGFFRTGLDGHFIEANAALAHIYGFDTQEQLCAELNANPRAVYFEPERRDEFLSQLRAQGRVEDFISKIRRRDGKTIWVRENARAVLDSSGRVLFLEGTVQDVTTGRETEQAMRKALQETQEAARAKSAFLAAMSHELKTPLNAVIGFSELILQQLYGPIGERYSSYVADIHTNGKRLHDIINDVLDIARMEGGLVQLNESAFALEEILLAVRDCMLGAKPDAAPIEIATVQGLPLLRADHRRIYQVVKNLLSNAVKFTPADGHIELKLYLGPDRSLLLEIIDSGIGMAPDLIVIALEPFKQLDSRLERRFEGAGLGLPLASALIRLHGGRLGITSTPGKGTIVNVAFPPERSVEREVSVAPVAADDVAKISGYG